MFLLRSSSPLAISLGFFTLKEGGGSTTAVQCGNSRVSRVSPSHVSKRRRPHRECVSVSWSVLLSQKREARGSSL